MRPIASQGNQIARMSYGLPSAISMGKSKKRRNIVVENKEIADLPNSLSKPRIH